MAIGPGSRIGGFEVLEALGSGGMGDVWRALDTRLGREVAIKGVRADAASDPELLARLEREARLLASVNHPNVAAIYGLEELDGALFLVLELVPGPTLAERIADGALPREEALRVASQIASALEAAHERGVIHRDLKPANVKVTETGVVKVLDFGLAKGQPLFGVDGASRSPTLAATTGAGVVLGTLAYMSPEQARGKPVDRRTDIWALGCVLYECLTGERAFTGETASDTLAAVLTAEPDFARLPSDGRLETLLSRCLAKDAAIRLRDAGDLRLLIEEALRAAPPARRRAAAPRAPRPRVQPQLRQVTSSAGVEEFPAFSPDGEEIVFSAATGGVRRLVRKDLRTDEERVLTSGENDAIHPVWAPDAATILYVRARQAGVRLEPGDVFGQHVDGDLHALDLSTGETSRLVEHAFNPAFSPDGKRIAVDASWAGPRRIWTLDPLGHNPQQVSSDDTEAMVHIRPRWAPDGRRIVFQNIERTKLDVRTLDLATRQTAWVTNDLFQDVNPVFSAGGRSILFSSYRSGGLNVWRIPVAGRGVPRQVTTGAGQDVELAVSRDGRRLAFSTLKQNADLWRLPVSPDTGRPTGAPEPVVATTREESRGAFSPDGRSIAFNSDRSGQMNLFVHSLEDAGTRAVTRGPGGDYQASWFPDGRRLAFFSSRSGAVDVWTVDLATGDLAQLTHESTIDVNPCVSPDGERIAFQSDRSGRLEVWIMNADGSEPRALTRVGVLGHFLRFTKDGRSILFRSPAGGGASRTMEVPVEGGEPRPTAEVAGGSHMTLSPDGAKVMDVVGHRALWVSPLAGGAPEKVFELEDPSVRIDYPVWSPDGRWVLFDRFRPEGGDIWVMEGFE
ncbi:MAG TPA: protein kinase [Thermoanaerobaculia bacterium]|nr:protein kinase [Thermoanaerobaculia bacterium]